MIVGWNDTPSVADGAVTGAITGIGFVVAATFMNGFYEQKKPVLSAIFGGYYTVGIDRRRSHPGDLALIQTETKERRPF